MLYAGHSLSDIQNHLGHSNVQSTTMYLHLDLNRRRQIQQHFIEYMRTVVGHDPKIEALLQGQNREDIMAWLDSL